MLVSGTQGFEPPAAAFQGVRFLEGRIRTRVGSRTQDTPWDVVSWGTSCPSAACRRILSGFSVSVVQSLYIISLVRDWGGFGLCFETV